MRIVLMGILLALWAAPATAQTTQAWTPAEGDYVGGPLVTTSGTALPELDFLALARGQGCDAVNVHDAAQLASVLQDALQSTRPILVEVDVA